MSSAAPTVRLAIPEGGILSPNGAIGRSLAPTVRLALADGAACRNGSLDIAAPTVRLAFNEGLSRPEFAVGRALSDPAKTPALLVSLVYLEGFLRHRKRYRYRNWAMDSGAYSAFASGTKIVLGDYIRHCRELTATDPTLVEIYALDVIGDWRASMRNTELMWKAGVKAIPCYHAGEPWDVLLGLARDYPKIALGGVARWRGEKKRAFASRCLAAVWPKKVHGFGFGDPAHALAVPFHSIDATNWEIGACRFGHWKQFGKLSVRGSSQNLRGEVKFYLELETKARVRWAKEMAELETA
jgi:hypothetical protein